MTTQSFAVTWMSILVFSASCGVPPGAAPPRPAPPRTYPTPPASIDPCAWAWQQAGYTPPPAPAAANFDPLKSFENVLFQSHALWIGNDLIRRKDHRAIVEVVDVATCCQRERFAWYVAAIPLDTPVSATALAAVDSPVYAMSIVKPQVLGYCVLGTGTGSTGTGSTGVADVNLMAYPSANSPAPTVVAQPSRPTPPSPDASPPVSALSQRLYFRPGTHLPAGTKALFEIVKYDPRCICADIAADVQITCSTN